MNAAVNLANTTIICHAGEEEAADPFAWKIRKSWKASDGTNHVGSTLAGMAPRCVES
jgi:hypothetical protein